MDRLPLAVRGKNPHTCVGGIPPSNPMLRHYLTVRDARHHPAAPAASRSFIPRSHMTTPLPTQLVPPWMRPPKLVSPRMHLPARKQMLIRLPMERNGSCRARLVHLQTQGFRPVQAVTRRFRPKARKQKHYVGQDGPNVATINEKEMQLNSHLVNVSSL